MKYSNMPLHKSKADILKKRDVCEGGERDGKRKSKEVETDNTVSAFLASGGIAGRIKSSSAVIENCTKDKSCKIVFFVDKENG